MAVTCPKWERVGSRAGAEGGFGQLGRNAGHLALGFRLCGASACAASGELILG